MVRPVDEDQLAAWAAVGRVCGASNKPVVEPKSWVQFAHLLYTLHLTPLRMASTLSL